MTDREKYEAALKQQIAMQEHAQRCGCTLQVVQREYWQRRRRELQHAKDRAEGKTLVQDNIIPFDRGAKHEQHT